MIVDRCLLTITSAAALSPWQCAVAILCRHTWEIRVFLNHDHKWKGSEESRRMRTKKFVSVVVFCQDVLNTSKEEKVFFGSHPTYHSTVKRSVSGLLLLRHCICLFFQRFAHLHHNHHPRQPCAFNRSI